MTIMRTDNEARRMQFAYRGTQQMPLPAMRIPVGIAGLIIGPPAVIVMWVFSDPVIALLFGSSAPSVILHAVMSVVLGIGGVVILLRKAGEHITPLTSIRYWIEVLRNEVRAPRADPDEDRTVHEYDPGDMIPCSAKKERVVYRHDPAIPHSAQPGTRTVYVHELPIPLTVPDDTPAVEDLT